MSASDKYSSALETSVFIYIIKTRKMLVSQPRAASGCRTSWAVRLTVQLVPYLDAAQHLFMHDDALNGHVV
jgi:hypothetical protein